MSFDSPSVVPACSISGPIECPFSRGTLTCKTALAIGYFGRCRTDPNASKVAGNSLKGAAFYATKTMRES